MKKHLLVIFILVSCFCNSIELKEAVDFSVHHNSAGLCHHTHFDDMFDLVEINNRAIPTSSQFTIEISLIFPKESYNPIWKPPVIS